VLTRASNGAVNSSSSPQFTVDRNCQVVTNSSASCRTSSAARLIAPELSMTLRPELPAWTRCPPRTRTRTVAPAALTLPARYVHLTMLQTFAEIRAAYPFSPPPTLIQVSWNGGPAIYAVCAIDALGMSAMLARPVTITSREPDTGRPVIVEVDQDTAGWGLRTAVVFSGAVGDECRGSADRCCGHINFFTIGRAARDWAGRHPEITRRSPGRHWARRRRSGMGIAAFGPLMRADWQPRSPPGPADGWMLTDYDFHPGEQTVRIFRVPPAGVLRLDDSAAMASTTLVRFPSRLVAPGRSRRPRAQGLR
jgi:Alkylmercury lyase